MIEVLDAIIKYGSAPVLIATVIFLVIWFAKYLNKQQQSDIKRREEVDGKLKEHETKIDQVLETVKDIVRNTQHTHPGKEEEENRRCNALVMNLLDCLKNKTEANRVSCFIYHNGGYSVTGRSFQKMSMLYELVDGKTVSVMSSYQNIPRTMLFSLTQRLSEQGHYDIPNIEDIKDSDTVTYQAFKSRGANAAYCGVIKDSYKNILGFVVVEYTVDKCKDEEKTRELIKDKISKISAALEVNPDAPLSKRGGNE